MKKTMLLLVALMAIAAAMAACMQKKQGKAGTGMAGGKAPASKHPTTLVAYFSATGTTAGVARLIAAATGGELYEIRPQQKYTSADLNWNDPSSRSCRENADPSARPAIVKDRKSLDGYATVYLGFPNWWNGAPRIVNTFVETYGLKGVRVVPFMTSGGSGIDNAERTLRQLYPDVDWQKGRLLNGASQADVDAWVKEGK